MIFVGKSSVGYSRDFDPAIVAACGQVRTARSCRPSLRRPVPLRPAGRCLVCGAERGRPGAGRLGRDSRSRSSREKPKQRNEHAVTGVITVSVPSWPAPFSGTSPALGDEETNGPSGGIGTTRTTAVRSSARSAGSASSPGSAFLVAGSCGGARLPRVSCALDRSAPMRSEAEDAVLLDRVVHFAGVRKGVFPGGTRSLPDTVDRDGDRRPEPHTGLAGRRGQQGVEPAVDAA